jgi:hypothetical protein
MKGIITLAVFSLFTTMYAQCPSIETIHKAHLKTVSKETPKFYVSSQSSTGSIASDKTYEMSFIAQPGNDYRLTTKAAEGSSGTITFEIYEMSGEAKMVNGVESHKKTKKVLANSASAGTESLEFSTDKTRKIYVAVTLTGGDKKKPVCVGVLVEDKKSTKLGL